MRGGSGVNGGTAEPMNTLMALIRWWAVDWILMIGQRISAFNAINARQRIVGAILVIARAVTH